jgi:hypothetical protein
VTSHLPFRCSSYFLPRCSFSVRYHCSLLKVARPKRLIAKVPVGPGVSPLSEVSYLFLTGGETLPRMAGGSTYAALLTLTVLVGFFLSEVVNLPQCSVHYSS